MISCSALDERQNSLYNYNNNSAMNAKKIGNGNLIEKI